VTARNAAIRLVPGVAEKCAAGDWNETAGLSGEESHRTEPFTEWRDELLEPEGWSQVLATFAATMKLAVCLTDPEGFPLGECHNSPPVWRLARAGRPAAHGECPFCLTPSDVGCTAVADALRTGAVATVEDQAGLSHVAVPLTLGGRKLGALIAGQVFSRFPEPLPLRRVAREFGVSPQQVWQAAVQQVPVARHTLLLYADLLLSLGQAFVGQRYAAILHRRLDQTSRRYRLFIDGVKEYGLHTVDRDGRVMSWSRGAERLFGYTEAEMLGQDYACLLVPGPAAAEARKQSIAEADRLGWVEFEGWRVRKDGTRFIAAGVVASMGEGDDREYGGLVHDVTEVRRSEHDVQQAQKLESIGVLAGGIAHDFNNLLTGIIGGLSVIKTSLPPDDPTYPLLLNAEQAGARAAELVSQLLAYAGKGTFVVARFDLSVLISEMLPLLAASIPKAVELQLSLTPGLPWIEADPSQIRQIVMNLIINGAEAIGEDGGTVRVSTGLAGSGTDVFMVVKDSGSGMSETTRAKMFEPFFTTKFTGRGLGLAAVSGIVRSHKGKLEVTSTLGQGTAFTVSFPAVAAGAAKRPDSPATAIPRGSATILVVDDEPTLRKIARVILERSGYSVLVAKDGLEAVEIFRQNEGKIGAILLDMTMPIMGGHEAFGLLREIRPGVPIVISSGYGEALSREELGVGAEAGFIQKPYTAAKLVASIQAALQHA
jgi:PAS domain S-box-containing protein